MNEAQRQLIENLKLAGITYNDNNGKEKSSDEIINEVAKVANLLPPRLMTSIILNLNGKTVNDNMTNEDLVNIVFGKNKKGRL